MVPATTVKRIVSRFEKAVHDRACVLAVGRLDHATTFEYRQSKRELLALLTLLRTGENPDRAMEETSRRPKVIGTVLSGRAELLLPAKEPSPR